MKGTPWDLVLGFICWPPPLFFLSYSSLALVAFVEFEREGFEHFLCSCLALVASVWAPRFDSFEWEPVSLLLLEGDLLDGLVVVTAVTSSWKIVERPGSSPSWGLWSGCGACHLRSGGKANHKEKGPYFVWGSWRRRWAFVAYGCPSWYPAPLQRWLPFFVKGNIGIHLRLRVSRLFLYPSLLPCDSLRAWSYLYLVYHLWYISCACDISLVVILFRLSCWCT